MREGLASADRAVAHVFAPELVDELELAGRDGHHLARSRRLRPGERVTVADGAGSWRAYEVAATADDRVVLHGVAETVVEPLPERVVSVAIPLLKGGIDALVARCTELGVARVLPVVTDRTVVRWDASKRARALDRMRRVAVEASMQCRRARLPEVVPIGAFTDLLDHPGLVVVERGGAVDGLGVIERTGVELVACSGPEGGFSEHERAALAHRPRISVGRYTLRAETAVVAGVTVLVALG